MNVPCLAALVILALAYGGDSRAEDLSNLQKIERSAFIPADLALEQFQAMRAALQNGSCSDVAA